MIHLFLVIKIEVYESTFNTTMLATSYVQVNGKFFTNKFMFYGES